MESNRTLAIKSTTPAFFRSVGKFIDMLTSVMGFAGGVMLILASFVVIYQIAARSVFNSPSTWTFEVSILLVLVGVFFAVSFGMKEGSHVSVEILTKAVPAKVRTVLEIISYLFVLGYSFIVVRFGLEMVNKSYALNEKTGLLNLPFWPIKTAFLIAFVMLILQTGKRLIETFRLYWSEDRKDKAFIWQTALPVFIFAAAFVLGVMISSYLDPVTGLIILLLVLLAGGVPIGFSIAIVATYGMSIVMGWEKGISAIPQLTFLAWNDFSVIALPLFIFLGYVMFKSGLADELFYFARVWLGHIPGGLAVATMAVCTIFASISGSSVANAMTVGLIAIPAMIAYKYDKNMAGGLVAVGGTLGVLIPPSTGMILIGVTTEESVGKLFMSGVVPGIVAFVLLSITAILICKKTGSYEPLPKASLKERITGTKKALGSLLMPIVMLGGLYSGVFTPTEAASVGLIYALVFVVLTRRINWKQMFEVVSESTKSVAMAGILLAGGISLSKVTALLQVPQQAAEYIKHAGFPGWLVIVAIMILILILGMFLDGGAIILLTMPTLAPVVEALGYDVIWFAVLVILGTEIGMITPPVGLNVYVVQQVSGLDSMGILRGSLPFLLVLILVMLIVGFVPELALWLPNTM